MTYLKRFRIPVFLCLLSILFATNGFTRGEFTELSDSEIPEAFKEAFKNAEVETDILQEIISLDYKDAEISNVLRSMSYTYGLNLVSSAEIKGKITISLKEVTLAEALDAMLQANGYNYSRKGNIIYITPGMAAGAQLVSEAIVLNYLKAADAQNLLRKTLSTKGDMKVDQLSNMLVVTDYQANIDRLKELLETIDQAPQQVLIESRLVDITSKDLKNLGVTWEVDYSPSHGIFSRPTRASERLKGGATIPGPSSTLSGGQLKIDTLILKGLSASITLDALIQDQKANLLASPSIAVLNNHEARIIIGEKVPYKERVQTTTGTTETTKYIDVGTTLRVTPTINADGYITLSVHPEVSSVSALLDAGPRITTREADTTVRIKEGDTLVIGGLIKQEDNRTESRIPILGYIPILGRLFSNSSKDQTQIELAVFITPKILRSREEMLKEGRSAFQEEARVNILAAGSLHMQNELFKTARNLQRSSGLEARRKDDWHRKRQALSLYENIFTQFPDGPKAAEAGYRAARIYYYDLDEAYAARDLCAEVASDYPNSPYAARAKKLHRQITKHFEKEARRKAKRESKQ